MAEVDGGKFPTTHWSQIGLAGHPDTAVRHQALHELLRQYIAPMQLHLRVRHRLGLEEAEEVVQQFLVNKVIERHLIAKAAREKGRFRTFLLTSLDRFALNSIRDRRSSHQQSLGDVPEPAADIDRPGDEFHDAWAREVLANALRRMRDHCLRARRDDLWAVFEGRIIAPSLHDAEPVPYGQLVAGLQLDSTSDGFNLLATSKRVFSRCLRAVIMEYEKDERRIDDEIIELRAALSRRMPSSM